MYKVGYGVLSYDRYNIVISAVVRYIPVISMISCAFVPLLTSFDVIIFPLICCHEHDSDKVTIGKHELT